MPRTPEPELMKIWRKALETPQCCHTCENYTSKGVCEAFGIEPPAEFTSVMGQCDHWEDEIPF